MKKITCPWLFMLLIIFMWSATGLAENSSKGKKQLNLSLGLGAVYSSTPYRGADSEITPFPLLGYEGERLFLRGTKLGLPFN